MVYEEIVALHFPKMKIKLEEEMNNNDQYQRILSNENRKFIDEEDIIHDQKSEQESENEDDEDHLFSKRENDSFELGL